MSTDTFNALPSSYKDTSGYMFSHNGNFFRAVNRNYEPHYKKLMGGLYQHLTSKQLLVAHSETSEIPLKQDLLYILKPEQIPFISYVWEWSFSMLKDAALCTLNNAIEALKYGMILKDANTSNIQFLKGSPILIDTLSFETYQEGESWIAYRQFCEHFLAPLVLMQYTNSSIIKLTSAFPNGIPLSLCADMLPFNARLNLHVNLHIFLQQKLSAKKGEETSKQNATFSKQKLETLLQGLKSFVQSIQPKKDKTTWDNYYDETILSQNYLNAKKLLVQGMLEKISFSTLLDLGANDGVFSRLYQHTDKHIISLDEDRNCIEKLYQDCKTEGIHNIIPLVCDLTQPSSDIGWNNEERPAMFKRIKTDVTLALALIHHLAIANNLPLEKIIAFFHQFSENLIIEFVPKDDPKVKQLLAHRIDIFDRYTLDDFKSVLSSYYTIMEETNVDSTSRTLFLLKRKS